MKTHDVARALNTLARALRDLGNVTLDSITIQTDENFKPLTSLGANAPAALLLLVRLAEYSKNEWRVLLKELDIDVPIKPTDFVRDVVGITSQLPQYKQRCSSQAGREGTEAATS